MPQLIPVHRCRRLLSSHHVMASPRSSPGRGRPRWPGAIRDPGLPSALASAGGGPGGFRFLRRAVLPALSPRDGGKDTASCSLGRVGTFLLARSPYEGVPWGAQPAGEIWGLRIPSDLQLSHHSFEVQERVFAPERSSLALLRASDGLGPGWWDPADLVLRWCLNEGGRAMLATGLFHLVFNGD